MIICNTSVLWVYYPSAPSQGREVSERSVLFCQQETVITATHSQEQVETIDPLYLVKLHNTGSRSYKKYQFMPPFLSSNIPKLIWEQWERIEIRTQCFEDTRLDHHILNNEHKLHDCMTSPMWGDSDTRAPHTTVASTGIKPGEHVAVAEAYHKNTILTFKS
jgi:hypothetical protein